MSQFLFYCLQIQDFCTLAKSDGLLALEGAEEPPPGSSVKVVSDQLLLALELEGVSDGEAELARLSKDRDR